MYAQTPKDVKVDAMLDITSKSFFLAVTVFVLMAVFQFVGERLVSALM